MTLLAFGRLYRNICVSAANKKLNYSDARCYESLYEADIYYFSGVSAMMNFGYLFLLCFMVFCGKEREDIQFRSSLPH